MKINKITRVFGRAWHSFHKLLVNINKRKQSIKGSSSLTDLTSMSVDIYFMMIEIRLDSKDIKRI